MVSRTQAFLATTITAFTLVACSGDKKPFSGADNTEYTFTTHPRWMVGGDPVPFKAKMGDIKQALEVSKVDDFIVDVPGTDGESHRVDRSALLATKNLVTGTGNAETPAGSPAPSASAQATGGSAPEWRQQLTDQCSDAAALAFQKANKEFGPFSVAVLNKELQPTLTACSETSLSVTQEQKDPVVAQVTADSFGKCLQTTSNVSAMARAPETKPASTDATAADKEVANKIAAFRTFASEFRKSVKSCSCNAISIATGTQGDCGTTTPTNDDQKKDGASATGAKSTATTAPKKKW
jgi:hypothetical protein